MNLKLIGKEKCSKKFLRVCWKAFCEYAEELHVDVSAYTYAKYYKGTFTTHSISFHDNENCTGGFSLNDIYYDDEYNEILQYSFGLV